MNVYQSQETTALKAALFDLVSRCNMERTDPELSVAEDLLTKAIMELQTMKAHHKWMHSACEEQRAKLKAKS